MKISHKATQELTSSNRALPATSYFFRIMCDERPLLVDQQINQTSQHGPGVVDTRVGSLAEEVGQQSIGFLVLRSRYCIQFVDDTTEKHRLAFARIAPDPQKAASPLRHRRKSVWFKIQRYESLSKPPLVSSMRVLSWRGSVTRRSARQRSLSWAPDETAS